MGLPSSSNSITLRDVQKKYSPDEVIWLLQEWIRGELSAFVPSTSMPVLSIRHPIPRPSWDFMYGILAGLNYGDRVQPEKVPSDLYHYGDFNMRPEGGWDFALHGEDSPKLRQIKLDEAIHFSIPLALINEHTGETKTECLHIHIKSEAAAGLFLYAKYCDQHFYGFNKKIRILAEDGVRGMLFNSELSAQAISEHVDALAFFFTAAFTEIIPSSHRILSDQNVLEGPSRRRAFRAVMTHLGTLIFNRRNVEQTVESFRSAPIELYPGDRDFGAQHPTPFPEIVTPAPLISEGKNRGGRPQKWAWEDAIHATWAAIFEGDLPDKVDPNCRKKWNTFMTNWFAERYDGRTPTEGEIRKRTQQIYKWINVPDGPNTSENL